MILFLSYLFFAAFCFLIYIIACVKAENKIKKSLAVANSSLEEANVLLQFSNSCDGANEKDINFAIDSLKQAKDSIYYRQTQLTKEALDIAISHLEQLQKDKEKAWIKYENTGAICSNCLEHICVGFAYCPECGEKV